MVNAGGEALTTHFYQGMFASHPEVKTLFNQAQQAARSYLDRTRSNLSAMGLRARAIVIRGGDVRDTLCALIDREAADLAVMSARGTPLR